MGSKFDVKLELLPLKLQAQLWVLGLDADTSSVAIAYRRNAFLSKVQYTYGGAVQASLAYRRFDSSLGYTPGSKQFDAGLVFYGFNFSGSYSIPKRSGGVGIGYGAKLLPFPDELNSAFNAAGASFGNMAGDLSGAANNPLAWYHLHSDDVAAVSKAIDLGQQIQDSGSKFGAGLRLNYAPQTGLTIYGGMQFTF